jgi:hypothetical protein
MDGNRYYGPFESLVSARDWCESQEFYTVTRNFMIIPLRRTDKTRPSSEDWYGAEHANIDMFIDDIIDVNIFRQWQETQ